MSRPLDMKLSLSRFVGALIALSGMAWGTAFAGPGSGSAIITPSASVAAGAAGTWSIQFTAAENMLGGQVRVTIPSGWTAPQSGNATSAGYVTVSTDDPSGTPSLSIASQAVTIDVDTLSVGKTVTLVYGDDGGGSNPSARALAATVVGPYPFTVASDPSGSSPVDIAASPSLSVIAAAPDHIEIAPSDTTVTAGAFAQYRLIARDAYGNRAPVASTRTLVLVSSSGQFFNPSDHVTPISNIDIASGKTSVRVDYRGTLATNGSPHSLYAFTTTGSPSLGGFDDVNITPAALSTTQSTISATSPVVANGSAQSSVMVTSKDTFGNPRTGDTVVLGVTGSAIKAGPGGPTDGNGQATGVVTDVVAEPVTVSATINAQLLSSTAPVSFVAGPVSAATSVVDATTPVTANGTSTSTVTVTAKDANGNPVSGQTVTLAINPTGGGAVITQPGGVTNASGVAIGYLSSTSTGSRTVTATIGATLVTDNAVVNFVAGSAASFTWTVDGSATAGVAEQVTLTAKDAQGHTVTTYTGTVNLSTNSTGVGDAVVEWSAPDALGVISNLSGDNATYTFAAGDNGSAILRITDTKAETINLSASAPGPATGSSSSLVVAPAAADKVQIVSGNGQSATVNTAVATSPKVKVLDAFDNPVPGTSVTFRLVHGGGSVDAVSGGGVDSTVVSTFDGTAQCDVWTMGTLVAQNPNRLRALIASGSVPSVDFLATATAGPDAILTLTPASKNVTVNSNQQVTATLTDVFGNPRAGSVVTVVIKTGLNGTLVEDPIDPGTTTALNAYARQGATDATGKMTVRYVAPAGAGLPDVLDASTATVSQTSVTDVTYTSTSSGATNLRLTFLSSSTQPAGTAAQFKIDAVDGDGNVDATNGATVDLTPEGGSGLQFSLSNFGAPVTQVTLSSGTGTLYVRGTTAGNWDITATTAGLSSDTVPLIVTDTGVIANYLVSTVSTVVAGASFNVSVTARDQYDNTVVGANNGITLSAIDDVTTNPALGTLLVGAATLSNGLATVGEQYTVAEPIRVQVSNAGIQNLSTIVTVTADVAKRITKVSGDGSGYPAGANRTLITRVLDKYDNPVSGQQVTFQVIQGGGSVLPLTANTDASGNASTLLTTGVVAADNRVRATILDGTPAIDEQVEFSVQTVAGGIAYFTVVPQKTSLIAGESMPVTITAYDSGDNVVLLDNTTQIQLSSSGSAQFGSSTGTLTAGVFTTTVLDTVVENFTITAQKQGGGPSGTSTSISVSNAGTYRIAYVSGNTSGLTAGASQVLQASVHDMYGNVVPGALITFSITAAPDGSGSFTDTDGDPADGIVVTDATGVGHVTYHTALTAGSNQIRGQILDGSPANQEQVTFTVNTVAGGIVSYTVEMDGLSTVAHAPRNVTITGYDINENPVNDSVTQVALSGNPGVSLVFGTNPVTLTNGVATTTVTTDVVQTYRVLANTVGQPGVNGLGPNVDVLPAPPAGTITATATKNTITADGVSTTTITSGVIKDAYGNQVAAGLAINLVATIGGSIPTSTLVAANGRISFTLQSSTTQGLCTVSMTSATGTATGNINITFAPKPAVTANHAPSPNIVVPGGPAIAFSIQVDNSSTTSVNLTTSSTFSFTDGAHTYSANLAVPQLVPASGSVTLNFATVTVDASFVPASYAPMLSLVGIDANSAPYSASVNLPAASLLVTSIEITSIVPQSGVVSRGQNSTVAVTVKNNGSLNAVISGVDLVFIPTDLITYGSAPELGSTVGPSASKVFNVPINVLAGATPRTYQIDAVATGTVNSQPVS
ncbi:MAG TPA: Ig-like domain-containing protein, partial [Candidatus Krumholzibacteria bacterium]|nr:Ig-like domain-containing protein [Candidatus Krumholzibacteria bacterium]